MESDRTTELRTATAEEYAGLPEDVGTAAMELDRSLSQVEDVFKMLACVPFSEVQSKLTTLEKAKLDALGAYAVNSLFWNYLNINEVETEGHGINAELKLVKSFMQRIKEAEDKAKAPRIDKEASKRFVRNALWDAAHSSAQHKRKSGNDASDDVVSAPTKSAKHTS